MAKLTWTRNLLGSLTGWHAYRIMRSHRGQLDFDVAGRQARFRDHPDEAPYLLHGHGRMANSLPDIEQRPGKAPAWKARRIFAPQEMALTDETFSRCTGNSRHRTVRFPASPQLQMTTSGLDSGTSRTSSLTGFEALSRYGSGSEAAWEFAGTSHYSVVTDGRLPISRMI